MYCNNAKVWITKAINIVLKEYILFQKMAYKFVIFILGMSTVFLLNIVVECRPGNRATKLLRNGKFNKTLHNSEMGRLRFIYIHIYNNQTINYAWISISDCLDDVCWCNRDCPLVCGTDGKTYCNECVLECNACEAGINDLKLKHHGNCKNGNWHVISELL